MTCDKIHHIMAYINPDGTSTCLCGKLKNIKD